MFGVDNIIESYDGSGMSVDFEFIKQSLISSIPVTHCSSIIKTTRCFANASLIDDGYEEVKNPSNSFN